MSEFECAKHHLVKPSETCCSICGSPVVYMDGHSSREWAKMEEAELGDDGEPIVDYPEDDPREDR